MSYIPATLLLVANLALLGGCGQMGPLYMPPPETAQQEPAGQAATTPPQPTP